MSERTVMIVRSLEDSLAHVSTSLGVATQRRRVGANAAMSERTVMIVRSLEDSLAHVNVSPSVATQRRRVGATRP